MLSLIRRPNAPWVFGTMTLMGFAIFGFAIGALMLEPSEVFGERLSELTCLQVAFTPERYTAVFLSFPQEAREAFLRLLVPGDLVFAWGYGFQLAGLLGLLAIRLPGKWQSAGALIMWLPLLASVFDCVEDIFLYTIAQQLVIDPNARIAGALPLLASVASTIKYIALAIVPPVFGVSAIIKGMSVDRRASALLLYVLLGLLLFSMLLRPLQQIPPCF